MKKFYVSVLKLAIIVVAGIGLMCIGMMQEWRVETIIATVLFGGIFVGYFLGFFDVDESIDNHLTIKNGARSMRRAA